MFQFVNRLLTSKSLASRLLGGSAVTTALRMVANLLVIVTNGLITRLIDREGSGIYFTLWSTMAFLALIGQLGLRNSVVAWIAEAMHHGRPEQARATVRTATIVAHTGFLVMSALCGLAHTVWVLLGYHSYLTPLGLLLWMVWLVTWGIQFTLPEVFRGFERYAAASIYSGLVTNVLACLGLGGLLVFSIPCDLNHVLGVVAGAGVANHVLILAKLWQTARTLPSGGHLSIRACLDRSIPMMITSVARGVIELLDTVVVSIVGTPTEAALYGAASRLATLINIPQQIMMSVISPVVAAEHARGDKRRLEAVLRAGSTLAAVPGLAAVFLFVAFGGPVLRAAYGPGYESAAWLLAILSLGNVTGLYMCSAGTALQMSGHERIVMRVHGILAPVGIALQFAIAPFAGGTGVAMIKGLTLFLLGLECNRLCQRVLTVASHSYNPCSMVFIDRLKTIVKGTASNAG